MVDDDPQMQFFLKEALERQQYVVSVKGSAEEALDTLKDERFDLILMDVRLPGMSGLDAVDEIQKADRRTPIIIMTAHGTRDSALDAVRRGAYDYFTKPFSLDELEIIVRRALEKKRLLAELDRLRQQLAANRRRGRHRRREPGDGGSRAADRSRRPHRFDGADSRRERHRQGADRRGDPRALDPQRPGRS